MAVCRAMAGNTQDAPGYYPLEEILGRYSKNQLKTIFSNIHAIELTDGCSLGCPFCGFEAKKGPIGSMIWEQVISLERFKEQLKESSPMLYYASDPLDWQDSERDYRDVNNFFEDSIGFHPFISTAVPKGKEHVLWDMLMHDKLDRVSVSLMNHARLKRLVQGERPEVKIASSYQISVEDGLLCVQFYHDGQPKEDLWLDLLFHLQKDYHEEGKLFVDSRKVILTKDGKHDPNMILKLGKKNIDDLSSYGIGCNHGTILRPTGFYNVEAVTPSKEFPHGCKYTLIDPDNFQVIDRWNHPFHNADIYLITAAARIGNKDSLYQIPITDYIRPEMVHDVKMSEHKDLAKRILTIANVAASLGEKRWTAGMVMGELANNYLDLQESNPNKDDCPYYKRVIQAARECISGFDFYLDTIRPAELSGEIKRPERRKSIFL